MYAGIYYIHIYFFYYNNAHAQLHPNFNFVNIIICLKNMKNKDYYYY